jgi:hypothetical protein
MQRKLHVRFLGEGATATPPPYPTKFPVLRNTVSQQTNISPEEGTSPGGQNHVDQISLPSLRPQAEGRCCSGWNACPMHAMQASGHCPRRRFGASPPRLPPGGAESCQTGLPSSRQSTGASHDRMQNMLPRNLGIRRSMPPMRRQDAQPGEVEASAVLNAVFQAVIAVASIAMTCVSLATGILTSIFDWWIWLIPGVFLSATSIYWFQMASKGRNEHAVRAFDDAFAANWAQTKTNLRRSVKDTGKFVTDAIKFILWISVLFIIGVVLYATNPREADHRAAIHARTPVAGGALAVMEFVAGPKLTYHDCIVFSYTTLDEGNNSMLVTWGLFGKVYYGKDDKEK